MSTLAPELGAAIGEIVATIWQHTLGIDTEPAPGHWPTDLRRYSGIIQISGAWDGTVVLHCAERLAQRATCAMMGLTRETLTPIDVLETLAELTNMTGGNIKALLPEPCTLGLPVIIEGTDFAIDLPGNTETLRCDFIADGEPMTVKVLRRVTSGSR